MKWLRIIGILLFVWILSRVDWPTVLSSIKSLKPIYLGGYITCFACMILVRVIRLQICVNRVGGSLSFFKSYLATLEPAFVGVVTPGRVGELTRIAHLRHIIPIHSSIAVVVLERIIDLATLFAFGVGGVIYIFAPRARFVAFVATGAAILLIHAFFRRFNRLAPYLQPISAGLSRFSRFGKDFWESLTDAARETTQATVSPMVLLGTVCILLNLGQIFLLGQAFGFQADNLAICFAYIVATLLSLLPISPSGLGTREATYIYIMAQQGVSKEQALLFALLDAVVLGPVGVTIMLAPFWIARLFVGGGSTESRETSK